MLRVRACRADDLPHIVHLAEQAGPGFTSLAVGKAALAKRLEKSLASFKDTDVHISPDHIYLLMLEDMVTGQIIGMSAIKAQIGLRDPFFNFRVLNLAQKSAVTNRRFDMEVLMLVNEYDGATEVGGLFLLPEMRGKGAGRLISQARYMLMATAPERFADRVISELRGHVDAQGYSPFWEAIGRKFFHMDFMEADHISAEKDNQFILDLMPKYPIYAALLPEAAQKVIGQTHPHGVGARRYLEAEGFRYDGVIDIFDGGPSVSAPRGSIRTICESFCRSVMAGLDEMDSSAPAQTALISNDRCSDFCCVLQPIQLLDDGVMVPDSALSALDVSVKDQVRIWVKA